MFDPQRRIHNTQPQRATRTHNHKRITANTATKTQSQTRNHPGTSAAHSHNAHPQRHIHSAQPQRTTTKTHPQHTTATQNHSARNHKRTTTNANTQPLTHIIANMPDNMASRTQKKYQISWRSQRTCFCCVSYTPLLPLPLPDQTPDKWRAADLQECQSHLTSSRTRQKECRNNVSIHAEKC